MTHYYLFVPAKYKMMNIQVESKHHISSRRYFSKSVIKTNSESHTEIEFLNRLLFLLSRDQSNDTSKQNKYRQTMSEHGNEFNVET